jgi:tRNA(Ser,Leu) C12 N-acetylase TAN1
MDNRPGKGETIKNKRKEGTMYETTIPIEIISEEELDTLIKQLAKIFDEPVHVEKCYHVTTDNLELSSMLDSLKDGMSAAGKQAKKAGQNKGHKTKSKKSKPEFMGKRYTE